MQQVVAPPQVALNPLDSTLNCDIVENGLVCQPITSGPFGYMWAGARANYGAKHGRYYFKFQVTNNLPVSLKDSDGLSTSHVARVGVSVIGSDVG